MPDCNDCGPLPAAAPIIDRIFRVSYAMRMLRVDPLEAGVCVLINREEAFSLLDHAAADWEMVLMAPSAHGGTVEAIAFDLKVLPQQHLGWAQVFGVTLMVQNEGIPAPPGPPSST